MKFHILTLFPEMIEQGLANSILGKASQREYISVEAVNIRDFTENKHKKVDDYPYGGGAGMLMQAQPVYDAYKHVLEKTQADRPRVIYLTPQGKPFTQEMAREYAREKELIFLCGHYEGIDERVLEEIVTDYVSIGDYVLTGGELPAMVMIDAISRLVPGVLGCEESAEIETFHNHLLEYPQYTRPEEWNGKKVPQVLLGGHHANIEKWRLEQSIARTKLHRPDLYEKYALEERACEYLKKKDKVHHADMLDVIQRGTAKIFAVRPDGMLLQDKESGTYMLSVSNRDAGERLLSLVPESWGTDTFVSHQEFMNESICARFGTGSNLSVCFQAAYTRKTPIALEKVEIRPLHAEYAQTVQDHYHVLHDLSYILERMEKEELFGVFEDDKLAGFAGYHNEGSMGMLEIFEGYRRKGYARMLEAFLINHRLEEGRTPYCQIFTDNEASVKLQKKLGLRFSKELIFWLS